MWQTKAVAPSFRPFIINNLHCVEVVQPLLLLSIDTLRLRRLRPSVRPIERVTWSARAR